MEQKVAFRSDGLLLEGILHVPPGARGRAPAVAVCHPHPLYGGSMHNAVIKELCRSLEMAGLVALRFNFRGVGASEGSYDSGVGERSDVRAALDFLQSVDTPSPSRLGVAGYSFGAYVATYAAAQDPRVEALALISPPLAVYSFDPLRALGMPKLVVWGRLDELVSATIEEVASMVAEPRRLVLVEGANHLWLGREEEVCAIVTAFFKEALRDRGG
ncbi:MAG: alpha/beta hydrolase [Candidatus Nezhaarchaeota archaeon]|nr:alpha/beta hydrolase [Candidatus Nezhaarchaeota archaeon]